MQEEQFDAIIVGAGFSGIHHLHLLRQRGLHCTVIDAGGDFGGTWWWNTYPGVRVDSYIPLYELSIPELWKGWTWMEKFPAGKELQAYFTYAGEKLNLRPCCRFNTVVTQAHWDDQLHRWHVTAEGMDGIYKATARYLILCTGFASKPYMPNVSGLEKFKGPWCHTSRWPREGIETAGKRVAVIGTGASGVQVIQELGPQVTHLTVFQRTPNMALPMSQYRVHKEFQDHFKPVYSELYKKLDTTFAGYPAEPRSQPLSNDSEEEREAYYERIWSLGGFNFSLNNYQDILLNMESNKVAYAFWRKKVGERIKDPRKRELLAPAVPPHPIGVKRQSLELNFYEVFNQDNVDIVDLKATPILEINENGLKTVEREYEVDVLIFATGFDSYVGGFNDIDLRGLNGERIQDHWKNGVTTYLGMSIDNFPNLFFIYGPQGPTAFCNGPTCLQLQSRWIDETIGYLREHHITKFTPTAHAALTYKKHVNELCDVTLFPRADSWYMGANIPGKKRETYNYFGGLVAYTQELTTEVERGYPGFTRDTLTLEAWCSLSSSLVSGR